jgi:hypothetical protein
LVKLTGLEKRQICDRASILDTNLIIKREAEERVVGAIQAREAIVFLVLFLERDDL